MRIIDPESVKPYLLNVAPKGARIILEFASPTAMAAHVIACWECGYVAVPLDPRLPRAARAFIREDARPHLTINEQGTQQHTALELSDLDHRFIIYTSGTTGSPKGVVLTKAAVEHNARAAAALHGFTPESTTVTALPLYHVNALMMSLMSTHFSGGNLVLLQRFTPERFFDAIARFGAGVANVTPTQIADIIEAKLPWPEPLRYLLTAAAPLLQSTARAFHEVYGPCRIRQGYGMSEAVNFSFTMPELGPEEWVEEYVEKYPSVGVPVGDTEYRVDETGEVLVRGSSLMAGYWRNPGATAQAIQDGWLRTGDRGELRDGRLVLTGRSKEIIIRGGVNLSPVALEDAYAQAGLSGGFAVVGAQDQRLGETPAVVGRLPGTLALPTEIRPTVATEEAVMRTSTGKPQRTAMSAGLVSMSHPSLSYEVILEAVRPLAQRIVTEWADDVVTAQQAYIYDRALSVTNTPPTGAMGDAPACITRVLKGIQGALPSFKRGAFSGARVMREAGDSAWEALMVEAPMGDYATLASRFLLARGRLDLPILELGAGVGNLSRLIHPHVSASYYRTDGSSRFLQGEWGTEEMVVNFDEPLPGVRVDTVVAVNALHCAADVRVTLQHIHSVLNPGGMVVLGEGGPQPEGERPWALDLVFGFLDGWWDRGGFRSRATWLDDLAAVGFKDRGYSELRAGRYDLGGLVWATK